MSALVFVVTFLTLAGSFSRYMVPFSATIEQATAPPQSLTFLFFSTGLVVFPIVLIYTGAVHWVFRGKVRDHADDA